MIELEKGQVWENRINGERITISEFTGLKRTYILTFYKKINLAVEGIKRLGKKSTGITGWKCFDKVFKHAIAEIQVVKVKGKRTLRFYGRIKGVMVNGKMISFKNNTFNIQIPRVMSKAICYGSGIVGPGSVEISRITIEKKPFAGELRYEPRWLIEVTITELFLDMMNDFDRLITEEYGRYNNVRKI